VPLQSRFACTSATDAVLPHAAVSHATHATLPTRAEDVARSEALKLCAPTSAATTRIVTDVAVSAAWLTGAARVASSSSASARRSATQGCGLLRAHATP
jgi:hypothetical protein